MVNFKSNHTAVIHAIWSASTVEKKKTCGTIQKPMQAAEFAKLICPAALTLAPRAAAVRKELVDIPADRSTDTALSTLLMSWLISAPIVP
mmetsp:Transcript_72412/g.182943  ORF Transcript_72412/g.182943 Transcript_72412/m.182943 type:complete len:90 (-) Transcript_72412:426-695(-)